MQAVQARVIRHETFSGAYRVLEMHAPALSAAVQPGQFVHLRVPDLAGAALRRPFSVFEAHAGTVSLLYKTVGRGTVAMCGLRPEQTVDVIGPLGNGFPLDGIEKTIPVLVAGGYGVAPLYFLASHVETHGLVFLGGKSQQDILCRNRFEKQGWQVRAATEDGSAGYRGLVTDCLDAWLQPQARSGPEIVFFACGPDGLLRAVAKRAVAAGRKAWLSLDTHMGCGVGACLACVQKIRLADGSIVWKRVCRDGPVFEAREVVWPETRNPKSET
jgi:dihydroorotate dehydrogenase electron transfer subunit